MAKTTDIQNTDCSLTSTVLSLATKIETLIANARQQVVRVINTAEVVTKYEIGSVIVEEVLCDAERAAYGKKVLLSVSDILTKKLSDDWSVDTLEKARHFFSLYSNSATLSRNLEVEKSATLSQKPIASNSVNTVYPIPQFNLTWNHYLVLMRIENADERRFYEIESPKQNWSVRQLQRQYSLSLYERLA